MGTVSFHRRLPLRYPMVFGWLAVSFLIAGCTSNFRIPEPLEKEIDRSITFVELKKDPEAQKGKVVVLGGAVLRSKILKEGTQIEVLELPLTSFDEPEIAMENSQGRFMILDPDHTDPAILKDRRITVIGEVIGKKVETIDEYEYTFPYVSSRLIHIWTVYWGYYYPYPYYYYPYTMYYLDPFYPYPYPPWYYAPPIVVPPGQIPDRRFDVPPGKQSSLPAPSSPSRKIEGKSR